MVCWFLFVSKIWQLTSKGKLQSADRAIGVLMRNDPSRQKPRLGIFKTFHQNPEVYFQFVYDQVMRTGNFDIIYIRLA